MKSALKFSVQRMGVLLAYGVLGLPIVLAISMIAQVIRTHVDPLRNWFYPMHIFIPDHCAGSDPVVIYERMISKQFTGSYRAQFTEVIDLNGNFGFPICVYQSGEFEYRPRADIRATPKLSEFIGEACKLPPGKYRQETTWHPLRPGYVDETTSLVSNIFSVIPATDPRCVGGR